MTPLRITIKFKTAEFETFYNFSIFKTRQLPHLNTDCYVEATGPIDRNDTWWQGIPVVFPRFDKLPSHVSRYFNSFLSCTPLGNQSREIVGNRKPYTFRKEFELKFKRIFIASSDGPGRHTNPPSHVMILNIRGYKYPIFPSVLTV